ncbi:MAG: diaminopimelate decarboxylase [Rhodospirillales bacterium]|nr:diaminopimelate decarboxylase [Rhodospirillales bacterium]
MDHFTYRDGVLCAEDVPLSQIAEAVGTPFYCYSTATLEHHYKVFADALSGLDATVCYAVKANPNIAVISTLARLGAGADVVSGGELKRAMAAGVPPEKIVFSGVGKTRDELAQAIASGVMQINVESEPELQALNDVAMEAGVKAPVALRINPDIDAKTHAKISTGKSENKFGIEWTRAHAVYSRAAKMPGIDITGVAVHIGSQLTDLQPFHDAFRRLRDLVAMLRADGLPIRRLDLGGGLGIPYDGEPTPGPAEYAAVVRDTVADLGCSLVFEPGRMIVGNAGVMVSRIIYVKEGATRTFLIIDAAMNDLMRPSLYDAYHAIVPVSEPAGNAPQKPVDVVGPVCETGDTFCRQRPMPPVAAGDLLALRTAGAYGAAMASTYNTRPLLPEVLVSGKAFSLVRKRVEVEDIIAMDRLPAWISPAG